MKKNLNLIAMLMMLAIAGCQKEVEQPSAELNTSESALSIARTTGNTVNLNVTVEPGKEIKPDGGGVYSHGRDRVDARILSDGIFFFQTNTNDLKIELRKLEFNNPLNYSEAVNGKRNYTFRTGKSILAIPKGSSDIVGFTVRGIDKGGAVDWILQYRNGIESTSTETDYALVTRSFDGNSWTIEPANVSTIPANAGLYNADGYGNAIPGTQSYHVVPFKLTLTRK